jgi:hypothetical protein
LTLTGKNTWLTEDGALVVDVKNDMVLVTESLDQPTYQRLEQEVFSIKSGN